MKIRKATKLDLEKIIKIWIIEFRKTPWNERWTKEKVKKTISNYSGKIYVAVIDENIVGFVLVTEGYYVDGKIVSLEELVVAKSYQGHGIGSALLKHIEKIYKKKQFAKIFLNTIKTAKAYKFYKKKGYGDSKYNANMEKKLK